MELQKSKKRIILTGKYGTGKSRCIKEVFERLSNSHRKLRKIPIAINLRECRGLETPRELFNRHFKYLGLSEIQNKLTDAVIRNLSTDNFIFLIDGFDELLGDSWSTDAQALIEFRKNALLCVNELIGKTKCPVLITGREQYFNDFEEMINALGIKDNYSLMHLSCKDEFSDAEMSNYLSVYFKDNSFKIPEWLPKRPLICNVIAELPSESLHAMFDSAESSIGFWELFLEKLCEREVKIDKVRLTANAVKRLLVLIALKSREKIDVMGAITYQEITNIFSQIVRGNENSDVRGIDDSSSIFVQRLPRLARVEAGSQDRQFVDEFLLSGLRAEALIRQVNMAKKNSFDVVWKQNLTEFSIDICVDRIHKENSFNVWLDYLKSGLLEVIENKYILGDLISILFASEVLTSPINIGPVSIYRNFFSYLDLRNNLIQGISLDDCHVGTVYVSSKIKEIENIKIINSTIGEIKGVTSHEILPEWLKYNNNDFKMINLIINTKEVNASSLISSQRILLHIINRLVEQRGSARKLETLQKGIDKSIKSNRRNFDKILKKLRQENMIALSKGNEGVLVSITRDDARQRLGKIKKELNTSSDPIWEYVSLL